MPSRVLTSSVYRNTTLRSDIYDLFGWPYHAKSILPDCASFLHDCGLLGSATGHFVSNGRVMGTGHDGADFQVFEIHARQPQFLKKGQVPDVPLPFVGFRGLVISVEHPQKFLGRTIVRSDYGRLNPKKVRGLKRAGMQDPHFEARFEVYTNDQVEARYLVPPDLMERLLKLEQGYFGRNAQCAFVDGSLHIVLELDDRFCLSAPLEIPDYVGAANIIMGEISAVIRVLEEIEEFQDPKTGEAAKQANDIREAAYNARMEALQRDIYAMQDTWVSGYEKRNGIIDNGPELATMFNGWYGWKTKSPSGG